MKKGGKKERKEVEVNNRNIKNQLLKRGKRKPRYLNKIHYYYNYKFKKIMIKKKPKSKSYSITKSHFVDVAEFHSIFTLNLFTITLDLRKRAFAKRNGDVQFTHARAFANGQAYGPKTKLFFLPKKYKC